MDSTTEEVLELQAKWFSLEAAHLEDHLELEDKERVALEDQEGQLVPTEVLVAPHQRMEVQGPQPQLMEALVRQLDPMEGKEHLEVAMAALERLAESMAVQGHQEAFM